MESHVNRSIMKKGVVAREIIVEESNISIFSKSILNK
jgi:hypothetical protein